MKQSILLFSILLSFTFLSCEPKREVPKSESSISGYFDNVAGKQLTLALQSPEGVIPMDTLIIEEDGYFEFTPELNEMAVYRVILNYQTYLTVAAKKGDHVVLEANGLDVYDNYYVSGSRESELIKVVVDETMLLSAKLDSIKIELNHQKPAKDSKGLFKSYETQKELYSNYHQFALDFIDQQPGSIAAYFVVAGLQPDEDPDAYIKVGEALLQTYPKFNYIPKLNEHVKFLKLSNTGNEAPELNYPDPNGNLISLSSLQGKYVLVDFWASWCKPCRQENPNVLKLYNQYKDHNFEIYGYSLDKKQEDWIKAIKEDHIDWIHTSDLKGWQGQGSLDYGIQSIPATFLIDPNGTIIAKNLRGEQLANKLAELFDK